jgi:hypothetical protein
LKKKVRALEKKIKNIKIAEFLKKKRKLGSESGGGGKKEKKEKGEEGCFYSFKFATIKKDLRSMIKDKKDFYNIFFIRLGLLER